MESPWSQEGGTIERKARSINHCVVLAGCGWLEWQVVVASGWSGANQVLREIITLCDMILPHYVLTQYQHYDITLRQHIACVSLTLCRHAASLCADMLHVCHSLCADMLHVALQLGHVSTDFLDLDFELSMLLSTAIS